MDPNGAQLRDLPILFADAVTEATWLLSTAIERSLRDSDQWIGEPRPEILWNCLTFVLHLTDRVAFAQLPSERRDVFMDRLVQTLASKVDRAELWNVHMLHGDGFVLIRRGDDLKRAYNIAQARWSQFTLTPRKGQAPSGTLGWEFAKSICGEMYDQWNPAHITLISICATETFVFLNKVLSEMTRGLEEGNTSGSKKAGSEPRVNSDFLESMKHPYRTEMERIQAAQKQAEEYVNELPKEVVDQLGWANLVSDFQKEFLLGMLPSQELAEQLHNQALNAEEPAEE